jgi:predicted nucleic acid-binding protein
MAKIFVDTNILLYAYDSGDRRKKARSREVLKKLESEGTGVLSTQVVQEFYSIATRKLGLDPLFAKDAIASLEGFETIVVSLNLINSAIDCQMLSRISFWDALIVVAAESARCDLLWTEDLNPGQSIRGVRVENPLAP